MTTADLPPLLLQDVLAHPDVDDYRRIAADWFDEHGQPERGEFIRTQLELATVPSCQVEGKVVNWQSPMRACRAVFPEPHDGTGWGPHCGPCRLFVRLRSRSRELLDGVCGLGVEMLPVVEGLTRSNCVGRGRGYGWYLRDSKDGQGIEATFRRGFVEQVACPLQLWLNHGPELVRVAPLATVTISDREPHQSADTWDWWDVDRNGSDNSHPPSDLPTAIWHLLDLPTHGYYGNCKEATDAEAAHQALSGACLALAREDATRCPACGGKGETEEVVGNGWMIAYRCGMCGGTGRRT